MSPTAARARFDHLTEPVPESGCWIWMGSTKAGGYGQTGLFGHVEYAHRRSWELHNGPIPAGLMVCHRCDVRSCINPAHLFLGTAKDNVADMFAKGREHDRRGEKHGNAKLTAGEVEEIRASREVQRVVAMRYGVSQSQISNIRRGVRWAT